MKRHVLILLAVTLVVRGMLFISYPLGGKDDNQAAQRAMIAEVLDGNLLIGNVRYQTGYPLMIAPVVAFSKLFGAADERVVLFAQVALSSLIPFLIYDILRTRRSPREALVVALVVLFDPFGLEWAHFWLPEWLIALLIVLALWLVHHALLRRSVKLIALAGIALGAATIARMNVAPLAVVLGAAFFLLPATVRRERLRMFVTLGVSSGLVVLAYMVGIHHPSTGIWSPTCITGTNLVEGVLDNHVPVTADNGTATRHLLDLLTLKPEREFLFLEDSYPLWRIPGPWVTSEEQGRFLSQPYGTPDSALTIGYPGNLIYYLGPCPTDELLRAVYNEAVRAHPVQWLVGVGESLGRILVQQSPYYDQLSLPRYDTLKVQGSLLSGGFASVTDRIHYTGQRVWLPGIWLFSTLFDVLNLIKWLTVPALIWALWSKEWFYRVGALLLLVCLLFIAVFDSTAEPRLVAAVYPLYMLLIGGFGYAAVRWVVGRVNHSF